MNPVAILQHEDHLSPGSLQTCLQQFGIPMQVFRPDQGQAVPKEAKDFSGIVLLGSERCALDPVAWIRTELALCRDALSLEVPVLGLGIGAQMLTMAAGGKVIPCPVPSYGWALTRFTAQANALFGAQAPLELFNAHAHRLELPAGAQNLLYDGRNPSKGYALGPHLALLCPLELTQQGLQAWCARKSSQLSLAKGPDVQSRISMLRALPERMGKLEQLAAKLFSRWALQLPGAPRPVDAKLAA